MKVRNIIRPAIVSGFILLIPLALQLTIGTGVDGRGWNWKPGDFVVMGILLFGVALAIEFAMEGIVGFRYRFVAITVAIVVFLLIWAELAVGIFGTPFAGS